MRKKIIAGNWKMNKNVAETRAMLSELKTLIDGIDEVEVVIGAPFTDLQTAVETVKGSKIAIAAQNMYPKDSGAYTGEISPVMLKDLGVKYVILGHSERREYFKESNEFINAKVKSALAHDLIPILCIGEKLEEREAGKTAEVNEKQVREGLAGITPEEAKKVVVAYEPVWAIGTGKTATPAMAEETHKEIRDVLADMFGKDVAEEITIQYGGSMNPGNAKELMAQADIDGGLVGGASLEAKSFSDVIKAGL